MRVYCNWFANCVAAYPNQNKTTLYCSMTNSTSHPTQRWTWVAQYTHWSKPRARQTRTHSGTVGERRRKTTRARVSWGGGETHKVQTRHPATHTHTLHTACQRTWWNCVPGIKIFLSEKVITLTEDTTCWMSCLTFRVWVPNPGALPIIVSVSLTHIPCLFVCFYESVSCVYVFLSTCCSTCVGRDTNLIDTYVTVPIDVRITLLIWYHPLTSVSSFL